ncbi:MAG: hypothetical protein Q8O04_00075 [Deltaproteobacteria bacterium]|nr:hypothetical protein [Deltaproteobacteria bacterium]
MNFFSYRSSLFKLSRQRREIDRYYKKQYAEAKKTSDNKKIGDISSVAPHELEEVDDEIHYLEQRYLISIATRMLLPVPPVISEEKGGRWEQSDVTGKWQLTSEGMRELRQLIRTEKKESTELLTRWITIIVGLIGAITGLVAVIKK